MLQNSINVAQKLKQFPAGYYTLAMQGDYAFDSVLVCFTTLKEKHILRIWKMAIEQILKINFSEII